MKSNSPIKLFSLIGLVVFGVITVVLICVIGYVLATDGLDNLRGQPETGWGAMIAIFIYGPVAACFGALTYWCLNVYKKYARAN